MGIIRAAAKAIGGSLADQWLEVMEADDMGEQTVFTSGVKLRKGVNVKGSDNLITNGSVIHVYPNQFMILVDGGRIVDYTAEEGYYTVDNEAAPSIFNGDLADVVIDTFDRVKYGGVPSKAQKVYFINLQEIKGIKFGTRTPINYFDNFYNAELFLRAHGSYSVKITDPLRFYAEVVPKNRDRVEINSINEQYFNEFMEALQASINQMSADGIRISYVASKGMELSKYMSNVLDESWAQKRGMEVESVGIASISYDEESIKLINMRNQGAMLSDPAVREGYMQGAIARGMENAGSNANGAMAGFMGMNMGMNAGGSVIGAASAANMQQMQQQPQQQSQMQQPQVQQPQMQQPQMQQPQTQQPQMQQPQTPQQQAQTQASGWTCTCGTANSGKFCSECGLPRPADGPWQCECGALNNGKFCGECGKPRG